MASLSVDFIVFAVGSSPSTMFTRILAIFSVSLVLVKTVESLPAALELYSKQGFIPVYIRNGDTPLEEINSDLAEAFNRYALKHGRLTYGRQILNTVVDASAEKEMKKERRVLKEDKEGHEANKVVSGSPAVQHKRVNNVNAIPVAIFTDNFIQKIPKA